MAEYIEREAAIEYARLLYCKDCNSYNGVRCRACAFDDVMLLIEDAPTADVVEVRHGEWVEWEDEMLGTIYMCSVCKEDFVTNDGTPSDNLWNYCPYCGAKMDGKGEG